MNRSFGKSFVFCLVELTGATITPDLLLCDYSLPLISPGGECTSHRTQTLYYLFIVIESTGFVLIEAMFIPVIELMEEILKFEGFSLNISS